MTNQEAILEIERFIEVMQNDLRYYEPVGDALKIAMDALEKQIPMKPEYETDGYDENGKECFRMPYSEQALSIGNAIYMAHKHPTEKGDVEE